eukprot:m.38301 g.38301  ORF g.38301 m.38301 type:complete len:50 (+) comp13770_c1_seq2:70-219(+)
MHSPFMDQEKLLPARATNGKVFRQVCDIALELMPTSVHQTADQHPLALG